ncbi:MAG: hypothetical protein N2D54_12920 [Chloroflexota bacterium]
MWLYQIPIDQIDKIIGGLGFILVIGILWLVVRTVFKIASKVFMMGCAVILFLGMLAMAASTLMP